jgi:hypothetical protein
LGDRGGTGKWAGAVDHLWASSRLKSLRCGPELF